MNRKKGNLHLKSALMQPRPLAELMEDTLEKILGEKNIQIKENERQSFLPIDEPPEPSD